LAPVVGTVSLGRRDSHADQGAVATQFSNSTETGTSPTAIEKWLRDNKVFSFPGAAIPR
jgi:hypothetical protein